MTRMAVTLYCEQFATVEVDVPEDADDKTITQAALAALDESGGAEWESACGWVEEKRVLAPGEEAVSYMPWSEH